MKITVFLVGRGSIKIDPDPAYVRLGDLVEWEFVSNIPNSRINWTVYFQHGHPFQRPMPQIQADTLAQQGLGHVGRSGGLGTYDTGDFKYGVRTVDGLTGGTLSDDDPRLVVHP